MHKIQHDKTIYDSVFCFCLFCSFFGGGGGGGGGSKLDMKNCSFV